MEEYSASGASSSSSSSSSSSRRKMKTLEDLFRPPLDLMFRGTFQSAREAGIGSKKWLMVNVQKSTEFPCQVLNRDVWSNSAVKTILQEHFIFWQIYHDSEEGLRYMQFYPVKDWPYIAIIDPRTGEKIVEWQKIDAITFCDLITEFLSTQPSLEDGFSPAKTPPRKKLKSNDNIIEADEKAQLEAAIRASLSMEAKKHKYANSDLESDSDDDTLATFDSDAEPNDHDDAKATQDSESSNNSGKEKHKSSSCIVSVKSDKTEDQVNVVNGNSNFVPEKSDADLQSEVEIEDESTMDNSTEACSDGERWKLYLGKETDPLSKLIIRLPDGSRESISMPKSSKLMALVLYVASKGFTNESYELVTNFPKRQLSYLDFEKSLESVGLYPQETVFVQKR